MTCGCSTSEERTGCSSPARPRRPTPCSMPCSPTSSRSAVGGGGGRRPVPPPCPGDELVADRVHLGQLTERAVAHGERREGPGVASRRGHGHFQRRDCLFAPP